MVRRVSSLPKHCRHQAKDLGHVRLDGRVIYTGPWGSGQSVQAYNRLLAEWLANGRRLPARLSGESSYTIADLVADFWVHAESYCRKDGKPTRELGNIRSAMKPLLGLYGGQSAATFGPLALKALRARLVDDGLCRGVINQRVGMIKRLKSATPMSAARLPCGSTSGASKPPPGRPSSSDTELLRPPVESLPVAKSAIPSWLKSPSATARGLLAPTS